MMDGYQVDGGMCEGVFVRVEGHASTAETRHGSVSGDVDELCGALSDDKCAPISAALAAVYNRVLTSDMTGAVQQARNAVEGGRNAVRCIQNGDREMADQTERAAREVDPIEITDGKQL